MTEDDFLSRWSRRKLETKRDEEVPRAPAPDAEPAAADEPAITPEEIAALPPIEELTPQTDITGFLRKGVPEMLKNAALRRMWSLDPAIRDYVSEAREYAYDWNVPGGVPGNGPLLPSDNVGEMLSRIFGEGPGVTAPAADSPVARGPLSQNGSPDDASAASPRTAEDDAAQHEAAPGDDTAPALGVASGGLPLELDPRATADHDAALQPTAEVGSSSTPVKRRHGGAAPV